MGQAIPIGEYVANPEWLRQLLHENKAVDLMHTKAEEFRALAIQNSPFGDGGYAISFAQKSSVSLETASLISEAAAFKVTLEPRWHIIEYGNAKYRGVHSPPYAPLRRTAIAMGLNWEKT